MFSPQEKNPAIFISLSGCFGNWITSRLLPSLVGFMFPLFFNFFLKVFAAAVLPLEVAGTFSSLYWLDFRKEIPSQCCSGILRLQSLCGYTCVTLLAASFGKIFKLHSILQLTRWVADSFLWPFPSGDSKAQICGCFLVCRFWLIFCNAY